MLAAMPIACNESFEDLVVVGCDVLRAKTNKHTQKRGLHRSFCQAPSISRNHAKACQLPWRSEPCQPKRDLWGKIPAFHHFGSVNGWPSTEQIDQVRAQRRSLLPSSLEGKAWHSAPTPPGSRSATAPG
ncbi:hypothetical protein CCUS01_10095 [Colletotrichum cuscutae]|uniref:Uncharacterized protein n=1 Tax=Colletotrichum cuscutae TaxID=1209917 RepID=A0AAI9UDI4_9PEZI|nr:hypothetical protein CCUS01_10095 [Colletotrichum cuscutae]